MKFKYRYDDVQRLSLLEPLGEAEDYSVVSAAPSLNMDWIPTAEIPPERVLVAAVLAFMPKLSGRIGVDGPVHISLASAIRELVNDPELVVENTTTILKAIPKGHSVLHVMLDGFDAPPSPQVPDTLVARFVPSADRAGASFSAGLFELPTNLPQLSLWTTASTPEDLSGALPWIARAVLIAGEYGVGYIGLPGVFRDDRRWSQLVTVLKLVGLGVRVYQEPASSS